MAINEINSGETGENVKAQQSQPQQTQPTSVFAGNGLFGNSLFGAPISTTIGDEAYQKLRDNLRELYKSANPELEVEIIDVDRGSEPVLAFSCLAVAMRVKPKANASAAVISSDTVVAYHTLILESTGEKLAPVVRNVNNVNIELILTPGDAYDQRLAQIVQARVAKRYPKATLVTTEATVVPSDFNPDDKVALHNLALNIGLANGTELSVMDKNFRDVDLTAIHRGDNQLNVNVKFMRQQIADIVGAPQRSDVVIQFVSSARRDNNQQISVNNSSRDSVFSELTGFVDLVWDPVVPQQNAFNAYTNVPSATQKYIPRLVLTSINSNRAYTLGSLLLALATATSMAESNNWIQAFRPQPVSGNEIDLCDIGALNIEANLANEQSGYGTRIDTKANDFTLESLGKLVATLVRPQLVVSLDCPEAGPQTWYTAIFVAAMRGNTRAQALIIDAADQLTGGNFSRHFDKSAIFHPLDDRIHLGYWIDRNGTKRDIRDIDYLAVSNLIGERSPSTIRDFSDTFTKHNYPMAMRLAGRKKIISGLTNDTAVVTGYAQRVTFTSAFLSALAAGIRDTQLVVNINTPLSMEAFNNQRGVANFGGIGMVANGVTFMTQGGFAQMPNFGNQGGFGGGRFGY